MRRHCRVKLLHRCIQSKSSQKPFGKKMIISRGRVGPQLWVKHILRNIYRNIFENLLFRNWLTRKAETCLEASSSLIYSSLFNVKHENIQENNYWFFFVYRFYYTKLSMFFVYDCIMLRLYAYSVAQVIDVAYIPLFCSIFVC